MDSLIEPCQSIIPDKPVETEVLEQAELLTRRLHLQHPAKRDKAFEHYLKVILQSQFLKTSQLQNDECRHPCKAESSSQTIQLFELETPGAHQ